MVKRISIWLMITVLLLLSCTACAGEAEDVSTAPEVTESAGDASESGNGGESEEPSESALPSDTASSDTETPESESEPSESESEAESGPPVPVRGLPLSTVEKMQIVFDADGGNEYLTCAEQIRTALKETCGINLRAYPDAFYEGAEYEIVLGSCEGRPDAERAATLRTDDYFCSFDGKKIVLGAAGVSGLSAATEWFVTEIVGAYVENENGVFCSEEALSVSYTGTYAVDNMTLAGVEISEYIIIYPETHAEIFEGYAHALALQIETMSGYLLPVYQEHRNYSAAHEIHLGPTKELAAFYETEFLPEHEDAYAFCRVGDHVAVAAKSYNACRSGAEVFLSLFAEAEVADKTFRLALDTPIEGIGFHAPLRVMSFNVYYSDFTPTRADHVIETIEKHHPDTIGLQEVTGEWKAFLIERLGDRYAFLGEGRDGGEEGERSAIMYRTDLFNLIESKTLWLSTTPSKVSKFTESSLNRVMTYAILERKSDGTQLIHANTHLDHKSATASEKQSEVLLQLLDRLPELPTFATGDFNSRPQSQVYKNMIGAEFFDPAKHALTSFEAPTNSAGTLVIDYCFVRGNTALPLYYCVDTFKYDAEGADPSDHCPVIVDAWIDWEQE